MKRQTSAPIAPRLWAVVTLVLVLVVVGLAVALALTSLTRGIAVLACALGAAWMAWFGLRRRGSARTAALVVAALLAAAAIVLLILQGEWLGHVLILGALVGSLVAARLAFRLHVHLPAAPAPTHAVLFYNPRSGGGKAGRYNLVQEAGRRGIKAVELAPGRDLEELVRAAVAQGADALAMAGGDGSQAIVAAIAAEQGLPYACIPAGTRNHFALDLGVDRNDVVGALDALVNGGERRVDLAEVNGRVFVNNVSLGLYAEAVRRPGYREAKLHTILNAVPDVLGPGARPPAVGWRGPGGEESAAAILVSNDPYRLGRALASGTRPRLDRGVLGVAVLAPLRRGDAGAPGTATRLSMQQWATTRFEVHAAEPVAAGIDGESVLLEPPLRFQSRPAALRVRIAPGHPGCSPSARLPERPGQMPGALLRLAVRGTLLGVPEDGGAAVDRPQGHPPQTKTPTAY